MAVRNEDVAVGGDRDSARRDEMVLIASGHSGFPQRHQHLAVGTEFDDPMPEAPAGLRRHRDSVLARAIGHPHIAFMVDVQPVRPDEHARAEALDDVALRVEFVDRVDVLDPAVLVEAVDAEPAAVGQRHRVGFVASDERPDALAVDVDVHRCRRPHLASARKPRPLAAGHHRAAAIRQSLHRTIRVRQSALRQRFHPNGKQCEDAPYRDRSETIRFRHERPHLFKDTKGSDWRKGLRVLQRRDVALVLAEERGANKPPHDLAVSSSGQIVHKLD